MNKREGHADEAGKLGIMAGDVSQQRHESTVRLTDHGMAIQAVRNREWIVGAPDRVMLMDGNVTAFAYPA